MLSLVSPLLAFPAITSEFGASGWAAVAIGQSFGSTAAIVVELGWGLNGPQRVSRMGSAGRRRVFTLALRSKLFALVPLAIIAGVAAYLVSPDHLLEAALTAVGATAFGLSPAWFFIGNGSPLQLLTIDAVPRLVGVALSAVLMLVGVGLFVYPVVGLILPSVLSPVFAAAKVRVRRPDWRFARRIGNAHVLKSQWHAVVARSTSSLYISLPVGIVAVVAPQALVVFSAADRLQRMYLSVLSAVPNALQGWVGKPNSRGGRMARASRAIVLNAGFGLVVGLLFALAAPLASQIVFSGVATVPFEISVLCGVLIAIVCTSRATGNLGLVAARRIGYITVSAIVGSAIGLPAILVLSSQLGARGALIGAIMAETAVLTVQVFGLLRRRPTR